MDDRIDELVRSSAPVGLGADATAAEQSRMVARSIAADPPAPQRRVRKRPQAWTVGLLLGVGVFGVGATAAVAGPAIFEWAGWTPDAAAQRSFTLADGTAIGPCEVVARVDADYGSLERAVADQRTDEAREFLNAHDWSSAVASITAEEIAAAVTTENAQRAAAAETAIAEGRPTPPPASDGLVASMLMGDRITAALEDAGYLDGGVSISVTGYCGAAPTGAAQ